MSGLLTSTLGQTIGGTLRGIADKGMGLILSAFSSAKYAIQQDAGDVSILVIGDSTGNDTNEWVYLFGQWLAGQYPTFSVSYRLWDDAGNIYGPATSLGTGTGSNTIKIWNGSVPGTTAAYLMGSKLSSAVIATNPDVVIWNVGMNMYTLAIPVARGDYFSGFEQVRLSLPNAQHIAIRQNPHRDDDLMAPIVAQLDNISSEYGDISEPDAYILFINLGKDASLYIDNIHPSSAGTQLYLQAVKAKWNYSVLSNSFIPTPAFMERIGVNLLTNSDFSDPSYTGGLPASWISVVATVTKDTSVHDAGKSQSMKITGVNAGTAIYQQINSVSSLLGKSVTLAVRQYIDPASAKASLGRVALVVNSTPPTTYNANLPSSTLTGGWRWIFISAAAIPLNTTSIRVFIYCDGAANTDSAVYYDRVILVSGDTPADL